MINIDKQINYWMESSDDDIETAELLIDNKKTLHGLFFCHLALEKAIKAHVVKTIRDIPPRSHNLIYLSGKAEIEWEEENEIFLGILMRYQLEGRYPDKKPKKPGKETASNYLIKTKELLKWLKNKL